MKFYQYWNGFIWEFNSLGEYFLAVLGRLIGAVIGVIILFFFYYYGEGKWPDLAQFWNLIKSFINV